MTARALARPRRQRLAVTPSSVRRMKDQAREDLHTVGQVVAACLAGGPIAGLHYLLEKERGDRQAVAEAPRAPRFLGKVKSAPASGRGEPIEVEVLDAEIVEEGP